MKFSEYYRRRQQMGQRDITINWEYEDEQHGRLLTFRLHVRVTPEEPQVRYYPDESGYPGAPADYEFYDAVCTQYITYDEQGNELANYPDFEQRYPAQAKELGHWFLSIVDQDDDLRHRVEMAVSERLADAEEG